MSTIARNRLEGLKARQDIDDSHQAMPMINTLASAMGALAFTYAQVTSILSHVAKAANEGKEDADLEIDEDGTEILDLDENDVEVQQALIGAIKSLSRSITQVTEGLVHPLLGTKGSA